MKNINVVLFDDFTALDVFGAVEVLSRLKDEYEIGYFSLKGGFVRNSIGAQILAQKFSEIKSRDVLLIPGGYGTRVLVNDAEFIANLRQLASESEFVLCVCTGSVLLAKTGLLDGKFATTNKSSWQWATLQNLSVKWQKDARWIRDGKIYTSGGVAAGIDMALGFTAEIYGLERARIVAKAMEYVWSESAQDEAFA